MAGVNSRRLLQTFANDLPTLWRSQLLPTKDMTIEDTDVPYDGQLDECGSG